jgi:inner membrane protein
VATPLSHLAVPLALGVALGADTVPPGLLVLALAFAVLPDIDALGLWLGIPYEHPFGHRGFTHSLPVAVVLAGTGALFAPALGADALPAFGVLLLSTASHGLIDAMTNGGLGIAFFSPFSNRRGFLPWRVIEVSPLRPSALLSRHGLRALRSEMRWLWVPCGTLALLGLSLRELLGG